MPFSQKYNELPHSEDQEYLETLHADDIYKRGKLLSSSFSYNFQSLESPLDCYGTKSGKANLKSSLIDISASFSERESTATPPKKDVQHQTLPRRKHASKEIRKDRLSPPKKDSSSITKGLTKPPTTLDVALNIDRESAV